MIQINWPRQIMYAMFPFVGVIFGAWLDRVEDQRMSRFRDKSALYGRELAPGEEPSWPGPSLLFK